MIVTVQSIACQRFGTLCAVERIATPQGNSTGSSTPLVTNSTVPHLAFLRERTLFSCDTVVFSSLDGRPPRNETETARLGHCRQFGAENYGDRNTAFRSFGRSVSGIFAYDYDVDSQRSDFSQPPHRWGNMRLFFIQNGSFVKKDVRVECWQARDETSFPELHDVEFSESNKTVKFRLNNFSSFCSVNGLPFSLWNSETSKPRSYISIKLTDDYNIKEAASSEKPPVK